MRKGVAACQWRELADITTEDILDFKKVEGWGMVGVGQRQSQCTHGVPYALWIFKLKPQKCQLITLPTNWSSQEDCPRLQTLEGCTLAFNRQNLHLLVTFNKNTQIRWRYAMAMRVLDTPLITNMHLPERQTIEYSLEAVVDEEWRNFEAEIEGSGVNSSDRDDMEE
ncbi:uncharacterized protein Z518_09234 [Rhinocladiella mackenziei CBS 650.93]|uniref:Uncharacterized protein n=1 Tax=Rhinocladiella mackenziei CBS 650.93 TaxID=1442369 RepID=A0A0D2GT79_9EURO|nr:uncharacterized protein Z518_09234 [Rhinocladiella mackenziei CBS 650.93]KIX01508.1 hypothetical protein Z518_09234 [Rhinocladiella mackenziei CBS 650.93]